MPDEPRDESSSRVPVSDGSAQEHPRTLDYGVPSPSSAGSVLGSTLGLLLGLGGVAVGGAVPYLMCVMNPGGMTLVARGCGVGIYALLAVGAFWGTIRFRRARPWSGGKAFVAGIVLGVGLASLLEGICFGVSG
jgi:hypothetical protein